MIIILWCGSAVVTEWGNPFMSGRVIGEMLFAINGPRASCLSSHVHNAAMAVSTKILESVFLVILQHSGKAHDLKILPDTTWSPP